MYICFSSCHTNANSLCHLSYHYTAMHSLISLMLENKIYCWATLVSLQLGDVAAAAIVAVAVRVDASISLMSSKSHARSFSLSES